MVHFCQSSQFKIAPASIENHYRPVCGVVAHLTTHLFWSGKKKRSISHPLHVVPFSPGFVPYVPKYPCTWKSPSFWSPASNHYALSLFPCTITLPTFPFIPHSSFCPIQTNTKHHELAFHDIDRLLFPLVLLIISHFLLTSAPRTRFICASGSPVRSFRRSRSLRLIKSLFLSPCRVYFHSVRNRDGRL
jgi:hypothetical protein